MIAFAIVMLIASTPCTVEKQGSATRFASNRSVADVAIPANLNVYAWAALGVRYA